MDNKQLFNFDVYYVDSNLTSCTSYIITWLKLPLYFVHDNTPAYWNLMNFVHVFFLLIDFFNWIILIFEIVSNWSSNTLDPLYMENIGKVKLLIIWLPMQIRAYHHWCCGFESQAGQGVQHYVIKFVSDLRQVGGFLRVLQFPPPINLTATI
jgi:hypothetical protein